MGIEVFSMRHGVPEYARPNQNCIMDPLGISQFGDESRSSASRLNSFVFTVGVLAFSHERRIFMTLKPFDRRTFIKVSSTTMASLLMGCPETGKVKRTPSEPRVGQADTETPDSRPNVDPVDASQSATPDGALSSDGGHLDAQTDRRDAQSLSGDASASDAQSSCTATTSDITGPYWREGIPIRQNFDVYGDAGSALRLSGSVRDEQCNPLTNAVIEMWHALPTDVPVGRLSERDSVDYDTRSQEFRYYGQFATDGRGEYAMSTKKPGWYLNGQTFRPSHIHVRIYVDGAERLTTQLYFENDPFIAGDPWASAAPGRVMSLRSDADGALSGRFDFTVSTSS